MSGKFFTLKRLSAHLPVPAMTAVTHEDLEAWWTNFGPMRTAIERILATISLTSSAFLDEHLAELDAVMRPIWREDGPALVAAKLAEAGLDDAEPVAVRSSGSVEDGDQHSYAGLFLTRLNVSGTQAICQAIEQVWASNFGRAVLLQHLRSGSLTGLGEATVILQRMVPAVWAGVAFSHDPVSGQEGCIAEAVAGLGEALVSGERCSVHVRIDGDDVVPSVEAGLASVFRQVGCLLKDVVTAHSDAPMDIEWAFDGAKVWLIQARRITTMGQPRPVDAPTFEVVPLYAASDAEIEPFKPLPDFAAYFRSKRKPIADFASRMHLPAATSLLVHANRAGLDADGAASLMAGFLQPQQVLDFSARVRQQVLPRSKVVPRLQELLGASASVFVLRDFVQGEGGLISRVLQRSPGDACVLCEWSSEGLLAINRGTASTVKFTIDPDGSIGSGPDRQGTPWVSAEQARLIHAATVQAQEEFGSVQLEWVNDGDALYILDYSLLQSVNVHFDAGDARVISPGFASGVPVIVDASRDIEQLSIAACVSLTDIPAPQELGTVISALYERISAHDGPAIIVSPRPYAALSPLVPFAAGFVFQQASMLCHLAILIREQGIPALESSALYRQAVESDTSRLTVDASTLYAS